MICVKIYLYLTVSPLPTVGMDIRALDIIFTVLLWVGSVKG